MSGGSGEQVHIAYEAMEKDARKWDEAAEVLKGLHAEARQLELKAWHFSYFADKAGAYEEYQEVQEKLTDLMGQGSACMESVAGTLRRIRARYQEAEGRAEETLVKVTRRIGELR